MTKRQIFMKEWRDSAELSLKELTIHATYFQEIQHMTYYVENSGRINTKLWIDGAVKQTN
jgi:hypothetical protein